MQRSWREDGDKLTFIVCLPPSDTKRAAASVSGDDERDGDVKREERAAVAVKGGCGESRWDGDQMMIGDVNLFLSEVGDDEEDGAEKGCVGEVEIMIARTSHQGRGMGTKILVTFLWYIFTNLESILSEYSKSTRKVEIMKYLRVKIDAGNARSIRLFEKVGFKKISEEPNYFNELELRYEVPEIRTKEVVAKILGMDVPIVAAYELV